MRVKPWSGLDSAKGLSLACAAFLILAPALPFLPVFLAGKSLYGFDVIAMGVPFHAEMQRSLAAHQWPLWMPDLFGGMPGVASCNFLFTYPTDFLATVLGLPLRLQLGADAALHSGLAGLGLFLFLRRLGRSRGASLLGAFFFAVSGSQVSKVFGGHYNFIDGIPWLPWAFWAAHKGIRERSAWAWGLCGLAFALQILADAAQLCCYSFFAVLAFSFFLNGARPEASSPLKGPGAGQRWAPLWDLGIAAGLCALLSAPQLWPTLQYLPFSTRLGYSHAEFIQGSLGLSEAVTWLVPGFYGWQTPSYHGAMQDCFTTEYFGLLPWALAGAALAALWRREPLVRWMAGLALAAFFFAQGWWTPFYGVFHALPVLSGFRIWFRILFLLSFAVCCLAAYGWDALRDPDRSRAALRGALGFSALALVAIGLAWLLAPEASRTDAPWISRLIPDPGRRDAYLCALARQSVRTSALLLAPILALLWLAAKRPGSGVLLLALALAVHAGDEQQVYARFVHCEDSLPTAAPRFNSAPPAAPGLEPWRIYDDDDSFPNNSILLGYENMSGRESVPMQSMQSMKDAMALRQQTWADLFNVRYLFMHTRAGSLDPADRVVIRENPGAYPRAWLVGKVRTVANDAEAYALLADPAFDPRSEVLLPEGGGFAPAAVDGSVTWLSRGPQSLALEVQSGRAAALVLSNAWYPSWKARVDSQEEPLLKADGGIQALLVTSGRHRVELRFDPGLFQAALAACLVGLLLLLGLFLRRPRSPKSPKTGDALCP